MDQENSSHSSEPIMKLFQETGNELRAEKGEDELVATTQIITRNGEKENLGKTVSLQTPVDMDQENSSHSSEPIMKLFQETGNELRAEKGEDELVATTQIITRNGEKENLGKTVSVSMEKSMPYSKKMKMDTILEEFEKPGTSRAMCKSMSYSKKMKMDKIAEEFEKPGTSRAMENFKSMSYSKKMKMDKIEEEEKNFKSFMSPSNYEDAVLLELIHSIEMSENMAKERLSKKRNEKEQKMKNIKDLENMELHLYVQPEMPETKEIEKPGTSKAMEKGKSIMTYSKKMKMDTILEDFEKPGTSRAMCKSMSYSKKMKMDKIAEEFEKPGTSRDMENFKSMSYSKKMKMDQIEVEEKNLKSFMSSSNYEDAVMLELIHSMEMSEKMAKERLSKKRNEKEQKMENIKDLENMELHLHVQPEMPETKEIEKPGTSKAMEKGKSIMTYSKKMTIDEKKMKLNLIEMENVQRKLLENIRTMRRIEFDRQLELQTLGQNNIQNTEYNGRKTLNLGLPNSQHNKEEVEAGNGKLQISEENSYDLFPSSDNIHKSLIIKVPKLENVSEPMHYLHTKNDLYTVYYTCEKNSTDKTSEIGNIKTNSREKLSSVQVAKTKNVDDTQKKMKGIPGKSLKKTSFKLNNHTKDHPDYDMDKEGRTSCKFKNCDGGKKVFTRCNKDSTDKTAKINSPTLQLNKTKNCPTVKIIRLKNKNDNTHMKIKDISDNISNRNSFALNNNTKEKLYNNKEHKGSGPLVKIKYEGGKVVLTRCDKDGTDKTTDNNKSSIQMNATRNNQTVKMNTTENTTDKERQEMKVFQKQEASKTMEYDKT